MSEPTKQEATHRCDWSGSDWHSHGCNEGSPVCDRCPSRIERIQVRGRAGGLYCSVYCADESDYDAGVLVRGCKFGYPAARHTKGGEAMTERDGIRCKDAERALAAVVVALDEVGASTRSGGVTLVPAGRVRGLWSQTRIASNRRAGAMQKEMNELREALAERDGAPPSRRPTDEEIEAACAHYQGLLDWSDDTTGCEEDAVAWLRAWIKVRDTDFATSTEEKP